MTRFSAVGDRPATGSLARRPHAVTARLARALVGPAVLCLIGQLAVVPHAAADETPEYRLKAAFLFNFAQLTAWPVAVGPTLNLCIPWQDPFGKEIDAMEGKAVGARRIAVLRGASSTSLKDCNLVFIPASAMGDLPQILDEVAGSPVLTVAESPGAARRGVALNMRVAQNRVTFEVNLKAALAVGLTFSSTLPRLATEVFQ